ncbi:MAG: hypothetical protein A2358_02220 [Candidatus Staskawiczbacteria bacterium RIFOXYB1_FULL_37_44]|uniref:Uncharacterized protein n=1 Tax=Candidatus Staskawiczbacteria bacterium RIFOXYB1_FULL_37_44 TaxID=1802223 RepID=A0A1G2ITR7_9BACT|nr:MAG: hypothetical protein A2358_02220 [Candidatus Staskawiczbacteria bacterium RIFOXYB1_FULL_37_44]OGZ82804.1 MAG: hypothetical protein A2416_03200 [Candidatus Staskawiczbacteria bacterium RIFOXYC1_FULL_37_52]OGZ89752.1 MAG: hypothetical protein A2444_01200 [Candidatus Staskawiczbacteria bacterium RIFOXYC2_FULL_37_19]OGZ90575.1 MAG: hypothetical protein A2581_02660 [Candidatus Staskawiczbacteria bacterium RIFOXYD1_FULL_37_110]
MNKTQKIILSLAILGIAVLPFAALAINDPNAGSNPTGSGAINLGGLITAILGKLWIIFGALAVIMFVYAGILFMTAQGAPEKVSAARQAFLWGVVGVVVGIIAFSIVTIVGSLVEGS